MKYLFIILFAMSAIAKDDEAGKLVEAAKARREAWKVFREKVSQGKLCEPRNYDCFIEAMKKIPGVHPEDIISARSVLEPFYLRSISEKDLPCGDSCKNNMRAYNLYLFLNMVIPYKVFQEKVYNFKDAYTVKATRFRAYMDLSAYGNLQKNLLYLKDEFSKIDFAKVTDKTVNVKSWYEEALDVVGSGKLLSRSVLCHIHPGTLVYDEIANGKTKIDAKYSAWLKDFDLNWRKACKDQTPLEYRGFDESTRKYYYRQTGRKLNRIQCKPGDYACLRKEFRNFPIYYATDFDRVFYYMFDFNQKSIPVPCDETCKAQHLLRSTQTLITFISQYDRQKLATTMDWNKNPEDRYLTISEDVAFFNSIRNPFTLILETIATLDPAKLKDEGLKSELKSISKDVSDLVAGKMFKDSVICTMEPWTAAYDKYMTPYEKPKRNKQFEKDFIQFKEEVCK